MMKEIWKDVKESLKDSPTKRTLKIERLKQQIQIAKLEKELGNYKSNNLLDVFGINKLMMNLPNSKI